MSSPCYTIGLTGGIASGKSAVSSVFEKLGCQVIDADIVAREVVEPNTEGLKALIKTFGEEILRSDLSLDRLKLRKLIFKSSENLKNINSILHPIINYTIKKQIQNVSESYVIVAIPLLCESSNYDWLNRVLVVDVKMETQLMRLLRRDGINEELALKMIDSQCTAVARLKIANDVINNEYDLKTLVKKVEVLNRLYKTL